MDNISDNLKLKDTHHNTVIAKDKDGNILFKVENLVVQRGRLFTLEKIFDDPLTEGEIINLKQLTYKSNINREIVFFKVGKGGTVNGPFIPIEPTASDTNLTDSIPFRTLEDDDLDELERPNYCLKETTEENEVTINKYYGKRFEITDSVWDVDLVNNLISKKITMLVDQVDCRDAEINELGLFFAEIGEGGLIIDNTAEMFSKITFASEIMDGLKTLEFIYTIYA
jgi:hypothetical protein